MSKAFGRSESSMDFFFAIAQRTMYYDFDRLRIIYIYTIIYIDTLRETNIDPENYPVENGRPFSSTNQWFCESMLISRRIVSWQRQERNRGCLFRAIPSTDLNN